MAVRVTVAGWEYHGAALWAAVADGAQGAIMAPTEILAEQHARSFEKMFAGLARPGSDRPVRIGLLTGRQRKAERDETLAALAAGAPLSGIIFIKMPFGVKICRRLLSWSAA